MVHLWAGNLPRRPNGWVSEGPMRIWMRGLVGRWLVGPPGDFIAGRPGWRLFWFGSLVVLGVACCYLWLFQLYINIKIGKNSCKMLY